jgi:hypothetical protein
MAMFNSYVKLPEGNHPALAPNPSNEAVGIAHGGEDQTTEKVGEVGCLAAIFRSNWMVPKGKLVIFPSVCGDC